MSSTTSPLSAYQQFIKDILRFTIIALLVVVPFRFFIAQPFIVSGDSMQPTFQTGEYLIIDQLSYHFQEPERGEVVVFKAPESDARFFIKRIIGLPGETVEIQNGTVTIYNDQHPDGRRLREPYIQASRRETMSVKLEPEEYFVMGDNRPVSSDSRSWGPLKLDRIQGRPILRLFPLSDISLTPGLP